MNRWAFLRRFPKLALVALVFGGSTVLFGLWWWWRQSPSPIPASGDVLAASEAASEQQSSSLANRLDRVVLAGADLYDADSGELVAANWLRGDKPYFLYAQPELGKVIGHYERGFERYALDGTKEATLTTSYGIVVSSDLEQALFARERDAWLAEIDWENFKLVQERPITRLGNLPEPMLVRNTQMGTRKFVLLRHGPQVLRLNLATGEVAPTLFQPHDIQPKSRSPDASLLIGQGASGNLFVYDLDRDAPSTYAMGGAALTYALWLPGNDAVALADGAKVIRYDRASDRFTPVCTLPEACDALENASPDGRYVFALARNRKLLVDCEAKRVVPWTTPGQKAEWLNGTSLLISNEVPDSQVRGTWWQTIGEEPRRLTADPFLVARDGVSVFAVLPAKEHAVFASRDRLYRVDAASGDLRELATLARPVSRLQVIEALADVQRRGKRQ